MFAGQNKMGFLLSCLRFHAKRDKKYSTIAIIWAINMIEVKLCGTIFYWRMHDQTADELFFGAISVNRP